MYRPPRVPTNFSDIKMDLRYRTGTYLWIVEKCLKFGRLLYLPILLFEGDPDLGDPEDASIRHQL